ncbi:hypothetical protein R1sor_025414 [Riccia sorocarpa]|uniref:Uncharacterized protein n=1 Tax=Riccia sorocarpa TaxID=122646 RepID=A0ABD3GA44_9MARC
MFGTVLENVAFDEHTREVNYSDRSVTENTRAAYPIEFIPNAKILCVGRHPKNIILLACDAFGVLPPVSKLTLAQTMYHFISGYTAIVAGTEDVIPNQVILWPGENSRTHSFECGIDVIDHSDSPTRTEDDLLACF